MPVFSEHMTAAKEGTQAQQDSVGASGDQASAWRLKPWQAAIARVGLIFGPLILIVGSIGLAVLLEELGSLRIPYMSLAGTSFGRWWIHATGAYYLLTPAVVNVGVLFTVASAITLFNHNKAVKNQAGKKEQ